MFINYIMSFRTDALYNTIAKGRENGKIGLRYDKNNLPETLPNEDFPNQYGIKATNFSRSERHENVVTMEEQVKFKEENVDIAGMEAGRINNFAFRGKAPMRFDPFANAVGMISDDSGFNAGSVDEFSQKKEPNLRKQNNASAQKFVRVGGSIPLISQPELRPPLLAPEGLGEKAKGFNMKIK